MLVTAAVLNSDKVASAEQLLNMLDMLVTAAVSNSDKVVSEEHI